MISFLKWVVGIGIVNARKGGINILHIILKARSQPTILTNTTHGNEPQDNTLERGRCGEDSPMYPEGSLERLRPNAVYGTSSN